jgi:hypothetical protein
MAPASFAETERLALRGVRLVKPNPDWIVPCGEACLPVWRRTEALEGAGAMRWGGYDESQDDIHGKPLSFIDYIDFSNHKWRLGIHCSNSACRNSTNSTLI